MSDQHSDARVSACCGSCQNARGGRPRYVVGVFTDPGGAHGAAGKLRTSAGGNVSVLHSAVPLLVHDLQGDTALSLMSCGRLFQQITHHLASGAAIVVVDAQSPEEQLGVSRVLLESNCDLLLTHDGAQHAHAD
ncbi:MAG: hypothetical protein ABI457_07110 [Hyphomicrobium sp.]